MKQITSVFIIVCLIFVACSTQKKINKKRENVNSAIILGINLLENSKYKEFIRAFVLPEQLEKFTKDITIEEFVENFEGKKANRLLSALKEIESKKPKYLTTEGNQIAEFILEKHEKYGIRFKKLEKFWYILD